jgi:hypothetical protein
VALSDDVEWDIVRHAFCRVLMQRRDFRIKHGDQNCNPFRRNDIVDVDFEQLFDFALAATISLWSYQSQSDLIQNLR